MQNYKIYQDEKGEYYIEGGESLTCAIGYDNKAWVYHPAITQLAEYDRIFKYIPNGQNLFELIKNILSYYSHAEVIDFLNNVCKTTENLGKKSKGEQNMPFIDRAQWLLDTKLMDYQISATGKPTPQPAKGIEVQDIYDKLMMLEENSKNSLICPPVKIGDYVYSVEPIDKELKRYQVVVTTVENITYNVKDSAYRILIKPLNDCDPYWGLWGHDIFKTVEEANKVKKNKENEGKVKLEK